MGILIPSAIESQRFHNFLSLVLELTSVECQNWKSWHVNMSVTASKVVLTEVNQKKKKNPYTFGMSLLAEISYWISFFFYFKYTISIYFLNCYMLANIFFWEYKWKNQIHYLLKYYLSLWRQNIVHKFVWVLRCAS